MERGAGVRPAQGYGRWSPVSPGLESSMNHTVCEGQTRFRPGAARGERLNDGIAGGHTPGLEHGAAPCYTDQCLAESLARPLSSAEPLIGGSVRGAAGVILGRA